MRVATRSRDPPRCVGRSAARRHGGLPSSCRLQISGFASSCPTRSRRAITTGGARNRGRDLVAAFLTRQFGWITQIGGDRLRPGAAHSRARPQPRARRGSISALGVPRAKYAQLSRQSQSWSEVIAGSEFRRPLLVRHTMDMMATLGSRAVGRATASLCHSANASRSVRSPARLVFPSIPLYALAPRGVARAANPRRPHRADRSDCDGRATGAY